MKIDEIKEILQLINFPQQYISEQTAICIMSLMDRTERAGLLTGHKNLSEGARIHDILNFARHDLTKKVAENTRESYRKTSLSPLMNYGLIVRHQLSTNDPNTYYRLYPDFARLLSEKSIKEKNRLINELRGQKSKFSKRSVGASIRGKDVIVQINNKKSFSLSAGAHNLLEKSVVEVFSQGFLSGGLVVYIGDTAPRKGFQDRKLMRKLNLPIDTSASLPDVILLSESEQHLVIVEAVTSSGSVSSIRLKLLHKFAKGPRKLGYKVSYITAFPSRAVFRKFIEDIAWGSSVWIEKEPNNIVHFERIR